jgi:hypothetical protein
MDTDTNTLSLDRATGGTVPLAWLDDAGVEIDISEADVTFYVKDIFTLVPTLDPENPKGRLLTFTAALAQSLGNRAHDYLITIDGVPSRGLIMASGFVPE